MLMPISSSNPFAKARNIAGVAVAILVVVLLAGVLGWRCSSNSCTESSPPNLLLISLDTLRADHLPIYGYSRPTSPNLERWASDGVVFEQATAQASSTLPSHRSLFQSRIASRTGADQPVLAEVLQRAGYSTAAFTGGGNVSATFGFDRGFDSYLESADPHGKLSGVFHHFETFLRNQSTSPFFVFLHGYDIHHPYDPPEPYASAFSPDYTGTISGRSTGLLLNKLRRIHQFSDFTGTVELSTDDRQRIEALYDGGILFADTYIGRVDALLTELGLAESTHVIVLSDHGEEFWDHGEVLHSFTVYQEMLHVPLILRFADGRHSGLRVTNSVRLLDVAPTLLHLAGVPKPASMIGHSLLPMMIGGQGPSTAVGEMHGLKAWLDPPWKLIVSQEPPSMQLFHLGRDPEEKNDVAASEASQAHRLLDGMMTGLGDSAAVQVSGSAREKPADPHLLEQLRALGYIE